MTRAVLIPVLSALVFAFSLSIPPSPALADCHNDCKSKYTECQAKCCEEFWQNRCDNHPFRSKYAVFRLGMIARSSATTVTHARSPSGLHNPPQLARL